MADQHDYRRRGAPALNTPQKLSLDPPKVAPNISGGKDTASADGYGPSDKKISFPPLEALRNERSKARVVHQVRRATPEDAELIASIADEYDIKKLDVSDHPENGWLLQAAKPDQIRRAMGLYKDYWIAEDKKGEAVGYQVITAPRFISRPFEKHKIVGPYAKRASQVLNSGQFIYMSQVAIRRSAAGKGAARDMQRKVLENYGDLPLVAHVASFTQVDFDAWTDRSQPFEPKNNNVASHRYHQREGYRLVAWTSDLVGAQGYNSGVLGSEAGVAGVLYVHFRDGAEDVYQPEDYVDPVAAIIDNPVQKGELNSGAWTNPLKAPWEGYRLDRTKLMDLLTETGWPPTIKMVESLMDDAAAAELKGLQGAKAQGD